MRLKYRFQRIQKFEKKNPEKPLVPHKRILDQTQFDYGNDGGCQSACLFECIERKFDTEISYAQMRKWYFDMDKFYNGRGEKIKYCLQYAQDHGVPVLINGTKGKVFVSNLERFEAKKVSFLDLSDACRTKDFCHIGIGRRGSAFFSSLTGKLLKDFAIPYIHAMTVLPFPKDMAKLVFQNHWTENWGKDGFGILSVKDFEKIKIWECFAGDLYFVAD